MVYKFVFTNRAEKDLSKLELDVRVRILNKLTKYINSKNPLEHSKKLKGFKIDTFRYRIGIYRVIFRVDKDNEKLVVLVVLRVGHRKNVY